MIEPKLIKAGDKRVLLGFAMMPPKVDVRIITEENYQLLKQAFDLHNVVVSCNKACSPSDYYEGGKCDKNGCYKK